jgi:hypothetical protein
VSNTDDLILRMLAEHLDNEPPVADPEVLSGHAYEEAARHHDEWDRTRSAYYRLLGVRLVNAALERRRA